MLLDWFYHMPHKMKVPTYKNRPGLSQAAEHTEFPGQHADEEVELVFRHHPVIMRRGLIVICVFALLGTLPTLIWPSLEVYGIGLTIGLLLGGLFFLPSWVRWYFSVFIVTSERLVQIHQLGFFRRQVDALFHARIHGVNYTQKSFLETTMHYGTINILTEVGNFDLKDVPHPEDLHEKILECVRDHIGEDE
ncbi:MAG TPA: PH domain-containing protein [Patescibacteria group bacterium]|jgi:hypothetical protein|nr:PH domain-containing protein [Patescibacteria group bacterium]